MREIKKFVSVNKCVKWIGIILIEKELKILGNDEKLEGVGNFNFNVFEIFKLCHLKFKRPLIIKFS